MKSKPLISLFQLLIVTSCVTATGACSRDSPPAAETEQVLIVAYDKGSFNMAGDWALLSNDQNLQIRSNLLADLIGWPRIWLPANITERDFWQLRGETKKLTALTGIEAKLDSLNGLVCLEDKCYPLMSICPPFSELKAGRKCQSFPKKTQE